MTNRQLQHRMDQDVLEAYSQRERTQESPNKPQGASSPGSEFFSAGSVDPCTPLSRKQSIEPDCNQYLMAFYEDAHNGLGKVACEIAELMHSLGDYGERFQHDYSELLHEYMDAALDITRRLHRLKRKMEVSRTSPTLSNCHPSGETRRIKCTARSSSSGRGADEDANQSSCTTHPARQQTPRQQHDTFCVGKSLQGGHTDSTHVANIGIHEIITPESRAALNEGSRIPISLQREVRRARTSGSQSPLASGSQLLAGMTDCHLQPRTIGALRSMFDDASQDLPQILEKDCEQDLD